jgi:arylsulfatase B
LEDANLGIELLSVEKLLDLRKQATISCNEDKNPINKCDPSKQPCLFNIILDPCERNNLAENFPEIVRSLDEKVKAHRNNAVPSRRTFASDVLCDPNLHNGTWSWWIEDSKYK